jgi:uridine kinase
MTLKSHFTKGSAVFSSIPTGDQKKFACCKINGRIRELTYVFDNDTDATVEYLGLENQDACRIYEASIRYLCALAIKEIDPRLDVRFFYNISRSVFVRVLSPKKGFKVTPAFVETVEKKMKEIIAKDVSFRRIKIAKDDALEIYRKEAFHDKIQVLKYRSENFVHLYECKDGNVDYFDYLYGFLVPSSGYLTKFMVRFYEPGFLIQVPRSEVKGEIPVFEDEIKFATTLASTSRWAERNGLDTVSNINRFIKEYGSMALVNVAEARINNMLADLGKDIVQTEDPIRLICIAGPSSSGKTSFANRLLYELMSLGVRPIRISVDNFYIPKDRLIPGTDLESLEAIDVPFFNDIMTRLISGEEVAMPIYDFRNGVRTFSKPIHLQENEPVIIEGIHALNPKLTTSIPEHQKYKVYIAPQPQVNIDNHTPLSMTDMRLLRRIARDARTRGTDATETISMWPNVRNGEFKYIYPTEENADFVFDSFYPYEPCALRNIVLPLLEQVKPEEKEYLTAMRLKTMVKYFLPIPTGDIPCNSLMREFVGGSSFKDAR